MGISEEVESQRCRADVAAARLRRVDGRKVTIGSSMKLFGAIAVETVRHQRVVLFPELTFRRRTGLDVACWEHRQIHNTFDEDDQRPASNGRAGGHL